MNQTSLLFISSATTMKTSPGTSSGDGSFLFPEAQSTVLPDPSRFFSPRILSSPLPTNSFFQNFVLKNGDQPEYIHPYLIKSALSSLSICYPFRVSNVKAIYQAFTPDLTISATHRNTNAEHTVYSFSDLSVTLDVPPSLRVYLARGSPFVTCDITLSTRLSISSAHSIVSLTSNVSLTRHVIKLGNNQTWLCYSSFPIFMTHNGSSITTSSFSGVIRFAIVPPSSFQYAAVLDRFSACYPVCGYVNFPEPFSVEYKWEKKGKGDLLLLAHPLHIRLLSSVSGNFEILNDIKYNSIDGMLVGVVGDSWILKTQPVSITWHSVRGVNEDAYPEIAASLAKDVEGLNSTPISTTESYFYGKAIARAARLALIAEEVCFKCVIPVIRQFLKDSIEPWLNGTSKSNGFLFDCKWGGIISKKGSADTHADFGFGIYNDHHYHLGHFLYVIAVLSKIDPAWGKKYRAQAYSLMGDFMNLGSKTNPHYPRLRNFDLWKLHSWAGGLTEFADGRNQESTSEAVNAYYSGALMGLSYGDTDLVTLGSTLAAFEMLAAQTWWHVREGEGMYEEDFSKENRVVGVLWANKRDSGLWFAPPEWRECRLGIQLLPLLPITEVLFADVGFAKELVKWSFPALARKGVGEGWKGFVYALEGLYDKNGALKNIRGLKGFDDGNSLTNLLWWIHSRGDNEAKRM